jgi:hypothetical protein
MLTLEMIMTKDRVLNQEERLSFLQDQLLCYFGDQDDVAGMEELKEEVKRSAWFRDNFLGALEDVLSREGFQCLPLVQHYANRHVNHSEKEARTWLLRLKDFLLKKE